MSKNSSLEDTAVGYNDAKCKEIDIGIEECHQSIVTIIKEAIEQEIVIPMSKAWYAEDAVEYMNEFKANTARISDDIQNRTGYNEMDQMNDNKSLNNQKKSEKSIFSSNFQKIFNRKKINNQLNSNEKNNSIESNYRSNNSARNISIAYNNNSISINKNAFCTIYLYYCFSHTYI